MVQKKWRERSKSKMKKIFVWNRKIVKNLTGIPEMDQQGFCPELSSGLGLCVW